MRVTPLTSTGQFSTVTSTLAEVATGLAATGDYLLASSTNAYVRQGTALKITCATQANTDDNDNITITANGTAVIYEFDKAGDGVTAGRVQVNISADTTAATVAARLRTAILANQATLRVIDPTDGTLQVDLVDSRSLTITENVTHASFTVTAGVMQASGAAGSMLLPAGFPVLLKGAAGGQVGIIHDSADGVASVTRVQVE
jgi:hypothetical protein